MTPRFGEITREFGDGTYVFRMTLGGIRELQDKCKLGAPEIYLRMSFGRWWVDDIREVVRLGLIGGGGVKPVDALKLIERYVDERPYFETAPLALEILGAVLIAPEAQKKSERETAVPTQAESEAIRQLLTSLVSGEMALSSDMRRPKSTT